MHSCSALNRLWLAQRTCQGESQLQFLVFSGHDPWPVTGSLQHHHAVARQLCLHIQRHFWRRSEGHLRFMSTCATPAGHSRLVCVQHSPPDGHSSRLVCLSRHHKSYQQVTATGSLHAQPNRPWQVILPAPPLLQLTNAKLVVLEFTFWRGAYWLAIHLQTILRPDPQASLPAGQLTCRPIHLQAASPAGHSTRRSFYPQTNLTAAQSIHDILASNREHSVLFKEGNYLTWPSCLRTVF